MDAEEPMNVKKQIRSILAAASLLTMVSQAQAQEVRIPY
jgi:hypothetical protein